MANELINPEGLRLDGRRPKELRRLNSQLGVLEDADGSAMFEMGYTKARIGRMFRALLAPQPAFLVTSMHERCWSRQLNATSRR